MNRLIVAFSSDTAAHRICAWLAQSGFPARTFARTGAEVVRAVRYMGGGSVICAARLPIIRRMNYTTIWMVRLICWSSANRSS